MEAAVALDTWLGLAGPGTATLGSTLIHRWSEPHRRYHTLKHLLAVLSGVDEFAGQADDPDAVRYAAWYHDAVYDSGVDAKDNEERSALLAEAELPTIGVAAARVAEAARLVRLTAGHEVAPGDRNGAVLCDADLAILGSSPETYAEYARVIRAEYATIPDEFFRPGRATILRGLLSLPALFRTAVARERHEQQARVNLTEEIRLLEQ